MKYKTKCTFCLTQLLNLKKYSKAKFYFKKQQTYLETENVREHLAIKELERYMQAAHEALQKLTELNEKQI